MSHKVVKIDGTTGEVSVQHWTLGSKGAEEVAKTLTEVQPAKTPSNPNPGDVYLTADTAKSLKIID
jgi:hypothetical protein